MKYIFVFFLSLTVSQFLFAQNDPNAQAVLKKVADVYGNLNSGQGEFTMSIVNKDANVNESQSGFFFIKGEMYRIETDMLDRVTNGKTVWTYFKDDEELQITDFDPEEEEINPAEIFSFYADDFTFPSYNDTTFYSFEYHAIKMFPKDELESYNNVTLIVNKVSNYIVQTIIESNNGSLITYKIDSFDKNEFISDALFNIKASDYGSDIDVIDLR